MKTEKEKEIEPAKATLDAQGVERIFDMLRSSDTQNHVVAYSIMENVDFEASKPLLMFIYKYLGTEKRKKVESDCPNLAKWLKSLGIEMTTEVAYEDIMKFRKEYPADMINVVLASCADTIKASFFEWDWSFMDDSVEVKVTMKQ